jgi:hypothetical protein
MTAAAVDLYIEQGTSFSRGFFWHHPLRDAQGNIVKDSHGNTLPGDPYDLTGWRGRMQVRQSPETEALLTATTENASGAQIDFGLDPENPSAEPDPANGRIDIRLDDETTDLLTITQARYDLKTYAPDGTEYRLMEGSAVISPAITKDE